ncbi:MAG: alanine racemase [Thermoanaerobaculaceae bacterium]|nr:alanine racemase [Thermoanaerobaculaceae bacterium]
MHIGDLRTPAAVVDLVKLGASLAAMRERANRLGVRLRPHVKTHKCVEIARLQHGGQEGPIAVSTLAEARAFASSGFRDITYAVPLAPQRGAEVAELVRAGLRLGVLVDHLDTVAALEACAGVENVRFPVWLKVDCGYHRCGVDPVGAVGLQVAARVGRSGHLELAGILTHAGHAYHCRNREEITAVARQERDVMVSFAGRLRQAGIPVPEVSVGSTPTMSAVDDLSGVTEIRPGNYAFHDVFQATIGSCRVRDCAFTVVATVVGSYPEAGRLVLDAGALALSKDPGPTHVDPACGFGRVCGLDGEELEGLHLASLSQEHGTVTAATATLAARFPIGTRMRIIPNHSCLAAACFDRYHVAEGDRIVGEWRPARGW